eukprot:gene9398-10381_t
MNFFTSRLRTRWGWWLMVSAVVLFLCIVIFNVVMIPSTFDQQSVDIGHTGGQSVRCHWTVNDPVVFNIRTKLGVNYDGGHWFHMAENILTMHSMLRAQGRLANSSQVFFNFDTPEFSTNLNGMTRFITYLGLVSSQSPLRRMWYGYKEVLWQQLRVPGDSLLFSDERLFRVDSVEKKDQWIALGSEPKDRFVQLGGAGYDVHQKQPQTLGKEKKAAKDSKVCVQYGGTIGGRWPTIQRGHWFPHKGDVEELRAKIRAVCPISPQVKAEKKKPYKLVLYQRDLSRKLLNQEEALKMIREKLSPEQWQIEVVMHLSSRSPCHLHEILHDTDVLLTPHGFQSMLLIFLPPGKLLFEVFPYKYYKPAYSPFSKEFGVYHGGVMSVGTSWLSKYVFPFVTTQACMQMKQCRVYSRDQDVILSRHGVNRLSRIVEEALGQQAVRQQALPGGSAPKS